ncbi:transporter substrate-binding domain-containing protein [Pectinatus cerevisiiphilus]|uniref:L-cystine transport system substrate-binding protein n=1 Tax=Pectinatus cerevisiiphilus TaxID=86956 RepID=A0A4R3K494_9FIRM|nr:transporter substrate-binding domain-containing protein [Pectinatus cerevisiiphilus]TCS77487.1 L-cystine transport system substrate-binding protein [Pectinatus cerevisiiphilus]
MKKRISFYFLLTIIMGVIALGCSSEEASKQASSSDANVREISVGVGSNFEPYAYIDNDNQPAGYDVAVLKEINRRLPQYQFKYQSIELKNLLLSLDAKKIQIATQQFEKNPDREEKYLFTNEGFANYDKRLVIAKGRTDIKTIDDLVGKKVGCAQGSNTAAILEKYNQTHQQKINIVYVQNASSAVYDDIVNGRLDAGVMTRKTFKRNQEAFGDGLDIVNDSLFSKSEAYFILSKNETQLRDDIDKVLKEMKEDGTLSKLSYEYTNSDYDVE